MVFCSHVSSSILIRSEIVSFTSIANLPTPSVFFGHSTSSGTGDITIFSREGGVTVKKWISLCIITVYTVRIHSHREIHFLTGTPLLKIVISPAPDGVERPKNTLGVGKFAILANGTISERIRIDLETCEQKIMFFSQVFPQTGL